MSLDKLPPELLLQLPSFLHSIEELLELSSTCRTLYRTCANPPPKIIAQLAAASGRVFFRPHPHTLIAACARPLADWAVQSPLRRFQLEESICGGVETLLELAIRVVGLTMPDIRRIKRFASDVLNPLDRRVDLTAGPGTGRPWTVCNDPATTLVSWVIYGELFHHSLELGYHSISAETATPQPLSALTRYKWLVYCVPDVNSYSYLEFPEHPAFFQAYKQEDDDRFQQLSMQTAIQELLNGPTWETALRASSCGVYREVAPGLRDLFVQCVMHLGYRSLEVLLPGGPERLETELRDLARSLEETLGRDGLVEAHENKVRQFIDDPWWLSAFPTINDDVRFTLWSTWLGEQDDTALIAAIREPARKPLQM